MPGFDMGINDKAYPGCRAVPNLVIASSLPFKAAAGMPKMVLQVFCIVGH